MKNITGVKKNNMREDIRSFLLDVQKPGRYTGGETNSVYKDLDKVNMRVAFCFPDTYEIGMSNLGMRILCECFNKIDDVWCERVYAPLTKAEIRCAILTLLRSLCSTSCATQIF